LIKERRGEEEKRREEKRGEEEKEGFTRQSNKVSAAPQ